MGLSFYELRQANDKRAILWNGGKPAPLSFVMMELAGEAGEACNAAKKLCRHEMGWSGGSHHLEDVAKELADVVICADLAASHLEIDLGEAVRQKFNETSRKHGFDVLLRTELGHGNVKGGE